MTEQEHKNIITQVMGFIHPDHQADASELLTSLSEDYQNQLREASEASEKVTQLTENNEKLRKVNADLFLKVGAPTDTGKDKQGADGNNDDLPEFEALFNEKGELI